MELLDYFNNYADHFDIKKLIHFGTEVIKCSQKPDESWVVEWRNLKDGQVFSDSYDALVVCNGHHHKPRYPDYPGEFSGEMINYNDFKTSKPFYDKLCSYLSSGPIVAMILEGEDVVSKNRQLMGTTDPIKAQEGTLRKMYGISIDKNSVHGSDSPENAKIEIDFFFNS